MTKAFNLVCAVATTCVAFSGLAHAERYEAQNIHLEDVTGNVKIVTNSGDAVEVVIIQGKTHHSIGVTMDDGVVTLKGEEWREEERRDCCNNRIRRTVNNRKDRKVTTGDPVDDTFFAEYPTIEIKMPRSGDASFVDARMKLAMGSIDGALNLDACYVYGEAGDVDEAVIGVVSGSRLVIGDVKAALEVDVSGDADVMAGNAAMVDVDIAGPGDVIVDQVDGFMDVSIAGSGVMRAARLDGPMTVRIAGSGVVAVKAGKADKLRGTIDGSGGIFFDGVAASPKLRLFGSSEVRLASVSGRIDRAGGGLVYVDDKLVEKN